MDAHEAHGGPVGADEADGGVAGAGTMPVPAIVGPTASGKTAVAIALARRVGGEVISMDSRQAYRGLVVGTAAPAPEELAAARHHGVGFLDPRERYGAGRFARLATGWIADVRARGAVPILAGGTGLFLRALTHPMFEEPALGAKRRGRLGAWLDGLDRGELARWAARLDPALACRGRPLDRQRAARTVELALLSGRPLSGWMASGRTERPPLAVAAYVLDLPAPVLRARIRDRAEALIRGGAWPAEVGELLARGLEGARAFDALGYADIAALVRGDADMEETIGRVFAATWRYARRQRTWFRHQLPPGAVVLDASATPEQLARDIAAGWRAAAAAAAPERGAASATDRKARRT